jgi:LuxR family transcriptional regulator of csgAB operon
MTAKYVNNADSSVSATQKLIYIVGPTRIQNSLVASFLEQSTHAKCRVLGALTKLSKSESRNVKGERIILWDCLGKEGDSCLAEYEASADKVSTKDKVAFFNVSPGTGIEERAMMRGIRGFFYEEDALEMLAKGIRALFAGELWISRKVMTAYIEKSMSPTYAAPEKETMLTTREIEILRSIATGATNSKVADKLCISPHTVRTHLHNTFRKIKVRNRLQAALWSAKNLEG